MESTDKPEGMIEAEPGTRKPRIGLSGKLLLLTIVFVMVAEIMIYVPTVANFRLNWLNDRLAAAHTAALVLDAAPSGMVPESLATTSAWWAPRRWAATSSRSFSTKYRCARRCGRSR